MRVGAFKRIVSFIFDAMPIILILTVLFTLFVGDLLKPDDYDNIYADYQAIRQDYFGVIEEDYRNGDITIEEYQRQYDLVIDDFNADTEDHIAVIYVYFVNVLLYHLLSFIVVYFVYVLLTKGRTMGRRLMKIELGGKVTFWRLFLREVLWKSAFWIITFGIGGIVLDIAMISFSRRKLALRDIVSGIYVKYEGIDYPF